jgi:hypothetical protein
MLKHILAIDPDKRATIQDIVQSNWVTNNGQEKIDLTKVEYDSIDKNGIKSGFGNISRLIKQKE